ncbi:hypothetical protein MA16_Dca021658 [Dendrobium catenatum]|uniref:Retrotransposon gag domain-containing protein n=2 Tax=Dendrobium catenatum TaxID=906689 RepID=A0A2I0W1J5_9ASPA|nr:hypothetical protein MA16_Dca021658 [Dendrobium catenatum]
MHIQRASDALLCQFFPATLKGQAHIWFYSLPSGMIPSFVKLAKAFVEQFIANQRIAKDSSHLSGIRQNEGESLKEYFQRFSTEARKIPGVDPELLRGVFLGSLRPGPFYSTLMHDNVPSYTDLIHRVEAQISADEALNAHRKQFEQSTVKRKGALGTYNSSSQRKKQGKNNLPPRPPLPRREPRQEKEYTPLNTSRANMLMAVRDQDTVKWPHPLNPNTRNQDQYCHFHRSCGHTTEACRQLKEEIERLILQGYLWQFIWDPPAREETCPTGGQDRKQRPPVNNRITIGEIEIIVGGPLLFDKVFLAVDEIPTLKKARVDHTITFDDSDLEGVKTPHQDPLVVSAGISDPCYNVNRILVDNGNSVDILFYFTSLNLGLAREKLQPATGPLYGFDNRPVRVEGIISLPVVLGEFSRQATLSVQFVVVKSESAYKDIFGRPLQSIFGIVTSIPDLELKFHTSTGVIVVCGDQQTAQTCYLRQVKTHPTDTLNIEDFDLRNEDIPQRASPVEELTTVSISEEHPLKTVKIGSLLSEDEKKIFIDFLRENQDIFTWSPADMPGLTLK